MDNALVMLLQPELAKRWFEEAKTICERDAGRLWMFGYFRISGVEIKERTLEATDRC
jgi:hypothetical protein